MTTDVAVFNPGKLPSFAKQRGELSALTKALAGGGGGGGYSKRISIKGGVFRLLAEGKEIASIEERYLDVVVVNAAPKISRMFYAAKFDENVATAPDCVSSDGDKPDAGSAHPQSNACANCPQNVKGSGEGDSRACRYMQRIAVVLANDMEGDVMQLQVPGKSLFGKEENGSFPLQAYARWLSSNNVEANEVITRMKFDTREAAPKLVFRSMRWLSDDEHEIALEKGATDDAKKAVLLSVDGGSSRPAQPTEPVKQLEKAPPADEDEDAPAPAARKRGRPAKVKEEEEETEPTVRKDTPAPNAVPTGSSLAALANKWDTDD